MPVYVSSDSSANSSPSQSPLPPQYSNVTQIFISSNSSSADSSPTPSPHPQADIPPPNFNILQVWIMGKWVNMHQLITIESEISHVQGAITMTNNEVELLNLLINLSMLVWIFTSNITLKYFLAFGTAGALAKWRSQLTPPKCTLERKITAINLHFLPFHTCIFNPKNPLLFSNNKFFVKTFDEIQKFGRIRFSIFYDNLLYVYNYELLYAPTDSLSPNNIFLIKRQKSMDF